jgi:hypothetical protein
LQKHKQKREEKVLQLLKRSRSSIWPKSVITAKNCLPKPNGVDLLGDCLLARQERLPERISTLVKTRLHQLFVRSPKNLSHDVAFATCCGAERKHHRVHFADETIMVVEKKTVLNHEVLSNLVG